jgi:radical SAM superfamily enzyme YgiQ (UPF0313 family)
MEKPTILLTKPPFFRLYNIDASLSRLPMSLAYLAGVIRKNQPKWNVRIYNSDFSPNDAHLSLEYLTGKGFEKFRDSMADFDGPIWQEIKQTIEKVNPIVVGITVTSQTFAAACEIARISKSINEDVLVIVGGPHPSIFGKEVLNNPMIDIAIIQEGEETIVEILDYVEGSRDISSIKGIAYRDDGRLFETPRRPLMEDIDSLPFPITVAKECLIDFEKYPLQAFKYVLGSRGCPFGCVFCDSKTVWGRKVRARSAENVLDEIEELRKFGVKYVHFIDDTWGINKANVRDFCEGLKDRRLGLKWSCTTHASLVDDEMIGMMKSAGCRMIQMGVESGNNDLLKKMGKNITIEMAFDAARIIKKHGIYLQPFFMVGFPDETEETLEETISAMERIPADQIIYSTFTPAITMAFSDRKEDRIGGISADFDATLYHHQSPANYFCENIPEDVFAERLRRLERRLDTLNSRRALRVFFSREGFLRMKEKGVALTLGRFIALGKGAFRALKE